METTTAVIRWIREALGRSDYSLETLVDLIRSLPDGGGPDRTSWTAHSSLDDAYGPIFAAAFPLLTTRDNDLHVLIGLRYVLEMLEREGGDPGIAVPGIILHDIGWSQIPEKDQRTAFGPGSVDSALNRLHETGGARRARELLQGLGYPQGLTDEVCQIIETHDSSPSAETLEEAIVKDADKIWRVSYLGFPLNLSMLGDLGPQQLHDFIAVRVPRWLLTATGRALAVGELEARRTEYGLEPAPDVPPPPGYGIGDAKEYE